MPPPTMHQVPEYVGPPDGEGNRLDVSRHTDRQIGIRALDEIRWVRKLLVDWVEAAAKTEMKVDAIDTRIDKLEDAKESSAVTEWGAPLRELRKSIDAKVKDPNDPLTPERARTVVSKVIEETRRAERLAVWDGRVAFLKSTAGKAVFEGVKVLVTVAILWAVFHFSGFKP